MFQQSTVLLLSLFLTVKASQNGWIQTNNIGVSTIQHRLTFWLKPIDETALYKEIDTISNPKSLRFRHYITDDAITKLVQSNGLEPLKTWLNTQTHHPFTIELSKHQDYAFVFLNVNDVSNLFGQLTTYQQETHTIHRLASGVEPSKNHVPTELQSHVNAIFGLTDFYPLVKNLRPQAKEQAQDGICSQFKGKTIDPAVLQNQYNSTPYTGQRPGYGKHSQGIAAFEQAQFLPADVAEFQSNFSLGNEVIEVIGPNKGGYYGEASLDTQYIFSIGSGVKTSFIAQDQFNMLEWAWLAMNMTSPPDVLSVSWGSR